MLEVGVKTDQTNGTYFLFGKDLQNLEFHNQKCFLRIKLFGAVLGFQQTLHIYFHLERFTAITSKGATIQEMIHLILRTIWTSKRTPQEYSQAE